MDELTLEIARGAQRIAHSALPSATAHAARRCLLDWFAAALGGSASALAQNLEAVLDEEFHAAGKALCVGRGKRCAPRTAALVNGTLAHTVEFDDIYSPALYHPGAPVIAAALAAAQCAGNGKPELLAAIVAGYETSNRIGVAINPAHYRYWHTTGTVGALGAAIAAGVALGLDRDGLASALAHAASMAAGLQQAFRSDADTKPLHAGRAADSGLLAALAARGGLGGAANMLDGSAGLGSAMSAGVDWRVCVDGLGDDFTIERMTVKNHGCCGHTFAALDALIELRDGLDIAQIKRVSIGTYQAALDIVGNPAPRTPSEARFSLPYCAAAALEDGRVRQAAFETDAIVSSSRRAMADRVDLGLDAQAEAAFPALRGASVTVELDDGATRSRRVEDRKGSPNWPLDDAALRDKLNELGAPVIGLERCTALADTLLDRDTPLDASALLELASCVGTGR